MRESVPEPASKTASPAPLATPKTPDPASPAPKPAESGSETSPSRDPQGLVPPTDEQLEALDRGKRALAEGRDDEALAALTAAWSAPTSGAAVSAGIAVTELLETRGDVAATRAIFESLLARAPRVPEVQILAGRFFVRQHEESRAVEALRTAIELQPEFVPAYTDLGTLLARLGRNEEAAAVLLEYELQLEKLIRRLEDANAPLADRLAVADLFSTVVDERLTEVLIRVLRGEAPELRVAAGSALADDDAPEALVALAEAALAERHPVARRAMADSLRRARARATTRAPAPH